MKKALGILLGGALLATAGTASAATSMIGTLGTIEAGSKLFADYDTVTPVAAASTNSQVFGSAGDPTQAKPIGSGNFFAVLGGGSTTYTFANRVTTFSLDAGTIDAYNTLTLNFLGGTSQSFDGSNLVGQDLRVIFNADAGQFITGVTLASTTNSFEFDNLAIGGAVPEPATWAMMIGGIGAVGGSLRRRSSRKLAAA